MNRPFCRQPRRLLGLAGLLGVGVLLSLPGPAPAQDGVPFPEDTQAFRYILSQLDLKPLPNVEALRSDPAHSVLIVFGKPAVLDQVPGGLKSFVERGGAVLVATDRVTGGSLQRDFGIQVTGAFVRAGDANLGYSGVPDCPFVEPLSAEGSFLFQTKDKVATNRPSFLIGEPRGVDYLAKFPADCQVVLEKTWGFEKRWGFRLNWPWLPFAAGGTQKDGRILVLADHSVFINLMMLQTDNGNFDLAYNCIQWLTERGNRNKVLFVDEGQPIADFSVPLQSVPDLPLSPTDIANQLIVAMEQDNLINQTILERFPLSKVISGWVLALTVALGFYGCYRLIRSGYHLETQVPLVDQRVAELRPVGAVVEQRHQSLLADGNLWEAARDLARQCLAAGGYDPFANGPLPRPRITVAGGWWRRQALRARVLSLWRLANDPEPQPVSRRRFARLHRHAADIQAALRDGTLHLDVPGGRA